MKKFLFPVLLIALAISTAFAQVPASFNYQAVVRNSAGEIISNQTVSFRISLLEDPESGTVVYSETHSLSTNDFGLVNLKIGKGTKLSGDFSPASWGDIIFTKIEIDPAGGDSFSELATTKLSSVPYAFKAQTVVNDKVDDADADPANELQTLTKSGSSIQLSNGGGSVTDAVDDADADATNELQQISISGTTLQLSKGGGTVTLPASGGGSADNWGTQVVKTDATLTGQGTTASPLAVVADGDGDDSNEIQTLSKSGSSIQLSNGGGSVTDAVDDADHDATNELQNLSLSGNQLSISDGNSVTLPDNGGLWTESGSNVYRTSGKVGIGTNNPQQAKLSVVGSTGDNKAAIYGETTSYDGKGVYGKSSTNYGYGVYGETTNESGCGIYGRAVHSGASAGYFNGNVGIKNGTFRLRGNAVIGNSTSNDNIPLHVKEFKYGTGDDGIVALFENSYTSQSLCDQADGIAIQLGCTDENPGASNDFISFRKSDGSQIAWINGNGSGGVHYATSSDRRLKMNIEDLSGAMDLISKIRVRKYEMKSAPGQEEIGFIAQELYEIYPQIVSGVPEDDVNDKPMGVDYGRLTPLLVKAIQEQQKQIDKLELLVEKLLEEK